MVVAAAAVPGGTNWTDVLTAIGTVGAVIVAVAIALFADYRSGERIKEERGRSDRVLAEQRAQDKAAIEDERAHGKAQIEKERRLAREKEQLEQAYAIVVMVAQRPVDGMQFTAPGGELRAELIRIAAIVVNRGLFTITGLEAQFAFGDEVLPHSAVRHVTAFLEVPEILRGGYWPVPEAESPGVLTPFDAGVRFETNGLLQRNLPTVYPVVRWTDRWGTRWEHKRGVVRQVPDGAPWEP